MKQVNKKTLAERDAIADDIREQYAPLKEAIEDYNALIEGEGGPLDDLREAMQKFNDALSEKWVAVKEALDSYQEAVQKADDWRTSVKDDIEEYAGARSDKWQESDAAQEYRMWIDALEVDFETPDLEEPEYQDVNEPEVLGLDDWDDDEQVIEKLGGLPASLEEAQ